MTIRRRFHQTKRTQFLGSKFLVSNPNVSRKAVSLERCGNANRREEKDHDIVHVPPRLLRHRHNDPRHEKIGDLNDGSYKLNWEFGPVEVAPETPVVMTYQIINHGHDDSSKQAADDINIAAQIAAGVTGVTAVAVPPAAVVLAIIGGALAAVGGLAEWILSDGPNCNGMVLSDALTTNGTGLMQLTQSDGNIHTEGRIYTGPETPHGCGTDVQYSVGGSIIRTASDRHPIHGTVLAHPFAFAEEKNKA